MDLLQEWQKMNAELTTKDLLPDADIASLQKSSKTTYLTLLKNLNIKLTWVRAIAGLNLILALITSGQLQIVFVSMFFSYELCRFFMSRQVRKLPNYIDYSAVTKDMIAYQLRLIKKALKIELIWANVYGPIAVPSGYMAYMLYKYGTLHKVISEKPNFLFILIALALLMFPIKYLGRKANQAAFGKDIEKLEAILREYENE